MLIETAPILREAWWYADTMARRSSNVSNNNVALHNQRAERLVGRLLSLGFACWDPTDPCKIDDLPHHADSAMDAEKRHTP